MGHKDITGELVSEQDIKEAITAVKSVMTKDMLKLPPELAVNIPNIHRCLTELLVLKKLIEAK